MALTAIPISGLAVLVSIAALVLGERRERNRREAERRAEQRAERAERREDARAHREDLEFRTSQLGQPTTDPVTKEPGTNRTYRFKVTNIGKAAMSDLLPILVDSSGTKCSEDLPNFYLGALLPGEQLEFVLKVAESCVKNPLYLRYTWVDPSGFGSTCRM